MPVERLTLSDGHEVAWTLDGPADKPVLALLNGSIFSMRQWENLMGAGLLRSGRYRLLRYDYPGTGSSGRRNGPMSMRAFATELVELLDHLSLDKVHVYGLSQGTMVAQALAAEAPERLRSVGGYGWFYGGYSDVDTTRAGIAERVTQMREMEHIWEDPLGKPHFEELWQRVYRKAIFAASWTEMSLLQKGKDVLARRMLFPLLAPTPIKSMHDWFCYCVDGLPEELEWLEGGVNNLVGVPTIIQHAVADQTLQIGMARELHAQVPGSRLLEYGDGWSHVSAALNSSHSKKVVADYFAFMDEVGDR